MRLRIALPILAAAVAASGVALLRAQQVNASYFADLHWRNVGPARSGYVSAPAGVPGDPTTYYAGMPEGGVWKTTNGGVTWKPIFDGVGIASVGAVAVAPSDHNVVYVGTGNQSGWSFTTGNGIYKSTDAGKTWTNSRTSCLAIHRRRLSSIRRTRTPYWSRRSAREAAERDAELPTPRRSHAPTGERRCLSLDRRRPQLGSRAAGGWTRRRRSIVWMDYGDPQMSSIASLSRRALAPGSRKSIDGGVTWTPVGGNGLPDGARIAAFSRRVRHARQAPLRGRGRRRTRVRPARTRRAASIDPTTAATRGSSARAQLASAGGKIYADPQRPDVVYLMGTAIYRSTDGGQARRGLLGRAERRGPALPLDRSHQLEANDGRRRSGRRRFPSTTARHSRRTTASSTASSIASRPTTTRRITSAARSRTRAPRACRVEPTSARSARATGTPAADSRTAS